jgi:hypothetical protein
MWKLAKLLLSRIGRVFHRDEPTNDKAAAVGVAVDCAMQLTQDSVSIDTTSEIAPVASIARRSITNTFALPERIRATERLNRPARLATAEQQMSERTSSRTKSNAHKVAAPKVAAQSVRMQAALAQSRRRHEAERKVAAGKVVTLPIAAKKPELVRPLGDLRTAA